MKTCSHVACKTCTDTLVKPSKQCTVCDKELVEKDIVEMKREGVFLSSAHWSAFMNVHYRNWVRWRWSGGNVEGWHRFSRLTRTPSRGCVNACADPSLFCGILEARLYIFIMWSIVLVNGHGSNLARHCLRHTCGPSSSPAVSTLDTWGRGFYTLRPLFELLVHSQFAI